MIPNHKLRCKVCPYLKIFKLFELRSKKTLNSNHSQNGGPTSHPPNITTWGHPLKWDRMVYKIPKTQMTGVTIECAFENLVIVCFL